MRNNETDVVVVGAGVAGGTVARELARLGHNVIVCEEHPQIGIPSHCSGHVGIRTFSQLGVYVPPKIIENEIRGATFYAPGGHRFTLERREPVTWVLNRTKFDRHVARLAASAGANVQLNSRVTGLAKAESSIQVSVQKRRGTKRLSARLVVDASGVGSPLARYMGLVEQPPSMFVNSGQVHVDEVFDVPSDFVELYFGQSYAPGFFAWIIPCRDGSAKVGLACAAANPREMMERFVRKHPTASSKLRRISVRKANFHPIPVGGAVSRSYADRYLAVGDAAGQVKATTGGGIAFSIICARLAAKTAHTALQQNDLSPSSLSRYEKDWHQTLDFDLRAMSLLRRMLYQIPDRDIDRIFRTASSLGAPSILSRGTTDIDFQGHTLLSLALRHPRFAASIAYATVRSLSSLIQAAFA